MKDIARMLFRCGAIPFVALLVLSVRNLAWGQGCFEWQGECDSGAAVWANNLSEVPWAGGVFGEGPLYGVVARTSSAAWSGFPMEPTGLQAAGEVGVDAAGTSTAIRARVPDARPGHIAIFASVTAFSTAELAQQSLIEGYSWYSGGSVRRKFRVDGEGDVYANAYYTGGADFAESVRVVGEPDMYTTGDVMALSRTAGGTVVRSTRPYSTLVAGIYSAAPGILAGRAITPKGDPEAAKVALAITGIVPCKVTAANGSILPGDLLVTSNLPGHAMKGTDRGRMTGAIVGKAMGDLEHGEGMIPVLVTLQ